MALCAYCEKFFQPIKRKLGLLAAHQPHIYCSHHCRLAARDAVRLTDTCERYGISVAEYWRLFESQSGKCAICKREPDTSRLDIDHDHQTGAVRGLLCPGCYLCLGYFKDNSEALLQALLQAAGYLQQKRHK